MRFINWLLGRTEPDLSGLEILEHARVYLEQYGEGRNHEFSRARQILIHARARILKGE